jgi:hypothetical protein
VALNWVTATEINNDYFTIQRSVDGLVFEDIEEITGAGNSNREISYQTFDDNPYNGTSYYRLKQTDFNGQFSFSQIEQVDFNGDASIDVYSSDNEIKLKSTGEKAEQIEISIRDAAGRLIHTETWEKGSSVSNHAISQNVLEATGVYIISLQGEYTTLSKRLFIR